MIGWGRIFLLVFVLMLLCFYISWKSFKYGNIGNTQYLNRIPNPESRIPNWSECTADHDTALETAYQLLTSRINLSLIL